MSLVLAMAGLGFNFNAGEHNERQIDALPAGWYPVQVVNSELKPTKTPGGARLNLQFKVLSGDFAGRVIFGGYNVKNANPVAVQIAMEELAELSRAIQTPIWSDTQELHAKPFNLKVKVRKQEGYNDNNEPVQYKNISDMDGVVYATKSSQAGVILCYGTQPQAQPQGFGQPQAQPQPQPAQASQPAWTQPAQQPVQPQQQPQQQPAQQPAQQPQQGSVNFNQAAQSQPWGNQAGQAQPEPQAQTQPQQTAQQQPAVQETTQQQPPAWSQQQVQPGTEQPAQQAQAQQAQEQPQDAIAEAAQSKVPPWKQQASA